MAAWRSRGATPQGPRLSQLVQSMTAEERRQPDRPDRSQEEEEEEEEPFGGEDEDDEDLLTNASVYEDGESVELESMESTKVLFEVQALSNFVAQEADDLSFKEREILRILESRRDDGWLLAENALGERGMVPCNYVKKCTAATSRTELRVAQTGGAVTSATPRRGRDLWMKMRSVIQQTSLADVLSAMGAVPSGFRESTLAKLLRDTSLYHSSVWVFPRSSPTGMAFKDLQWNHPLNQLEPRGSKVTRHFSVIAAKMIPLPGKGVHVLSRHVRIAVFNKSDMLSNIHTVRSTWSPQDNKSWKFAPKAHTTTNSLFHRSCVARVDSADPNLELLFELGITFRRESSGEVGELSCGWSALPLFRQNGSPTPSRTFELKIHGGTPFESGVELDQASNIKATGGLMPSILRSNQMPRFYVQLFSPGREARTAGALLPGTVVTCALYVPAIGCFRHLVGNAFLRGRFGQPLLNYVSRPALNVFIEALSQPDIMDATLSLWMNRLKVAKRADKHSIRWMSDQLESVLLECTYPLLHSSALAAPAWADEKKEMERLRVIEEFSKSSGETPPNALPTPLNISEQVFSIYP